MLFKTAASPFLLFRIFTSCRLFNNTTMCTLCVFVPERVSSQRKHQQQERVPFRGSLFPSCQNVTYNEIMNQRDNCLLLNHSSLRVFIGVECSVWILPKNAHLYTHKATILSTWFTCAIYNVRYRRQACSLVQRFLTTWLKFISAYLTEKQIFKHYTRIIQEHN